MPILKLCKMLWHSINQNGFQFCQCQSKEILWLKIRTFQVCKLNLYFHFVNIELLIRL